MKLLLFSLVGISTAFSAVVINGTTPGTSLYTVEGEAYDSTVDGRVNTTFADAVFDTGLLPYSVTYDLTGLDSGFTYDYALTASTRTGRTVDMTATMTNGTTTVTAPNVVRLSTVGNFNGVFTSDSLGTLSGLSSDYDSITFSFTDAAHFDNFDLSVTATAIPEPSAFVLVALGGGAFLARRRRAI